MRSRATATNGSPPTSVSAPARSANLPTVPAGHYEQRRRDPRTVARMRAPWDRRARAGTVELMLLTTTSTRRETALFRIGAGLIGLRVLDDTVLQPAAGTSVFDHPVSALVPL